MTKTGTQNRQYDESCILMVIATFSWMDGGFSREETLEFNWNNREEVRNFAAQSDRVIRSGGRTTLNSPGAPVAK